MFMESYLKIMLSRSGDNHLMFLGRCTPSASPTFCKHKKCQIFAFKMYNETRQCSLVVEHRLTRRKATV